MDPASTRSRLLQSAAHVFLQHGLSAASMEQVRQHAGASNGSLYHHFPTKGQLADALYADTLRGYHAAVMRPIAGRASAQNGVKGMVRAHVDWVVANPARARLLQQLRHARELAGGEWQEANAEGFAVLRAWVDKQQAAGALRAMPFGVWVAVVFAPVISLTRHWVGQSQTSVAPKVRAALEHAAWMGVCA